MDPQASPYTPASCPLTWSLSPWVNGGRRGSSSFPALGLPPSQLHYAAAGQLENPWSAAVVNLSEACGPSVDMLRAMAHPDSNLDAEDALVNHTSLEACSLATYQPDSELEWGSSSSACSSPRASSPQVSAATVSPANVALEAMSAPVNGGFLLAPPRSSSNSSVSSYGAENHRSGLVGASRGPPPPQSPALSSVSTASVWSSNSQADQETLQPLPAPDEKSLTSLHMLKRRRATTTGPGLATARARRPAAA